MIALLIAALLAFLLVAFPARITSYLLRTPQQGWFLSFFYGVVGVSILAALAYLLPFLQSSKLASTVAAFIVYYVLSGMLFGSKGKQTIILATVSVVFYSVQYVVERSSV